MIEKIILLLVIAGIVAFIVFYAAKPSVVDKGKKKLFDLSVSQQVVDRSPETIWKEGPCALRFGIFVQQAPRTLAKLDCISPPSNTTPTAFQPSCSDSDFKKCQCAGLDCSRCSLEDDSSSYYSKLVSFGQMIEVWAAGYAAESDKPLVPALLKIKTGQGAGQRNVESVPLPAIPLQRWTIITIVKEGRRFDVFYGAKLVSSKLLEFTPITNESAPGWFAGNPKWKGKIGFFNIVSGSWSTSDVEADVSSIVNRRGIPFYTEAITFEDLDLTSPCIFGGCGTLPQVKPANPFQFWNVQYS